MSVKIDVSVDEWPCPAGLQFCLCCRDYRVFLAFAELRHASSFITSAIESSNRSSSV